MGEALPVLEARHAARVTGIDARLASVKDADGERFDSAGWHYLDTLARRAAAHEGRVRRMLEAKLEQALEAFAARLEHARCAAAELLAATGATHPQAAAQLQQLFASGDFKGLRYLCATLEARAQCAPLAALVSQLESVMPSAPGNPSVPLATRLATARTSTPDSATLELKTVRESRATWARMSVGKQLALAMKQAPKNAGPINSHMLVLRSLALMQEISPDYLSRMVSYVDTLLSLDPGEPVVPVKRKKAAPAKAAKPTRTVKK